MIIKVALPDDEQGRDQRSLLAWLRRHDDIRTAARITVVPGAQQPDSMGSVFDAVQLALDPAFDLANLLVAVAAWRQACKPRALPAISGELHTITFMANGDVLIELGDRSVLVAAGDAADPQAQARALAALRQRAEEPGQDHTERGDRAEPGERTGRGERGERGGGPDAE